MGTDADALANLLQFRCWMLAQSALRDDYDMSDGGAWIDDLATQHVRGEMINQVDDAAR
ncbi:MULTISPECIES: hypothetical protein [unclassified Caballeronia]|uniref:hypothetical protein n=1 Tax=unclassified Caballeronia TaxID=2646786 RepID=UPI001F37F748|nr:MULTISPECIES: hypothetical protein [unclassified Caballeronia]MCE4547572.1 hypothetical protein [Caballeronia sp. PC1]MCE4575031.1 hypothetical protein [Caballeronia sp. CLC5]